MKRSTYRILTTHAGSLPRPPDLVEMLHSKEVAPLSDQAALDARVRDAVAEVVQKQVEAGVDVVSDGEQGKISYATYVKDRLTGFERDSRVSNSVAEQSGEFRDFREYAARLPSFAHRTRPACSGPIAWKDKEAVQKDIANLKAALSGVKTEEIFMTAASPGVIALFLPNEYYPSDEAYLGVLADVMKEEYNAIHQAGFLLQVDCPDLAMGRHIQFPDLSSEEFLKIAETHIEALNHALSDIPPDRLRLHLCWGNYPGPHHRDLPLKEIIGVVLKARPGAVSFEGANPRHEHEWKVFQDVKLPEGKVIMPGVLDTTTNFIEHPELVAQRIVRYAELVGRENVIAGSDCGFGTVAQTTPTLDIKIAWAKLQAMVEGARLASKELW